MAYSLFILDKIERVYKFPYPVSLIAVSSTPMHKMRAHQSCGNSWEIAVRFFSDKQNSSDIVGKQHISMSFPHVLVKPPQTVIQNNAEDVREYIAFQYSLDVAKSLMQRGLINDEITWHFELTSTIYRLATEIRALLSLTCEFGTVDRLDILCFCLLQELALQRDAEKCKHDISQISKVASYMRFHMEDNISIPYLAEKFRFSPRSFYRLWLSTYFESPLEWLKKIRLENAAEELATNNLSIKEIAARCGFHDAGYFAKSFRERYGVSPQCYRNNSLIPKIKERNNAD